jgi:hypothetical protein
LKHHDLIIPSEAGTDPFENCRLGRKPYADVLTQIVSSYSDGFVLAINNEWGAGKSTFIKMWRQDLINNGYRTLFYNAWENDFEKDVLVALISELEDLKDSESLELYQTVLEKGALLSKKIGPGILKAALKRYIGIDSEELNKVLEGAAEIGFDSLEKEIQEHNKRKVSLKGFRESLEKFIHKADPEKPVVFYIDELDRCRPNYAVEVLEEVKHLFSVPGIVFVLSIDKEQLGHAVRGVYGSEQINSEEYLRRFIDLEYTLPSPPHHLVTNYLFDFYSLGDFFNSDRSRQFINDEANFRSFALNFFRLYPLNFRQQEKLYGHLKVVFSVCEKDDYIFPPALLLLLYFKNFKNDLYKEIRSKTLTAQELFYRCENLLPQFVFETKEYLPFYYGFLLLTDLYQNGLNRKKDLLVQIAPSNFQTSLKSKYRTENDEIRDLLLEMRQKYFYEGNNLDKITNRIELLETLRN